MSRFWNHVVPFASPADEAASFTLDPIELARKRAASARRLHATQIPLARAIGFAVLCVMAPLQDLRTGALAESRGVLVLIAVNVGYATASWLALRRGYDRTGRVDLGLVFLHMDVLVWLVNLRHFEQIHPFFA